MEARVQLMREQFIHKVFNDEHQRIIDYAIVWLEDMRDQGFKVTLRQLYYMFISEQRWFPNTIQQYKRLGGIIDDGRKAGLIDWDLIEDRNRTVEDRPKWESPQHVMEAVVDQYREDLWIGQERRVHVRVEKDAVIGVVEPVCHRWRVPFIACRGYTSQSEAYAAGKLFQQQVADGLYPLVIYLGDHDPSGIDMTRDQTDRLSLYAGDDIEIWRIALNYDQVEELHLPPNPAKLTDSRSGYQRDGTFTSGSYCDRFGIDSWELDALKPRYVDDLISNAISSVIDHDVWNERKAIEDHNHSMLRSVLEEWDRVEETFGDK